MVELASLTTPRFWIPGWRQALLFVTLVIAGSIAWVLGTPSVVAPLFGEAFYERAFGFPFYFGATLYTLFALVAGFLSPRCFYLWGIAVLLPFPFASVILALWHDSTGAVPIQGGTGPLLSYVFVIVMMTVGQALIAVVISALGAGIRMVVHRLRTDGE